MTDKKCNKNFKCGDCNRSFMTTTTLNRHKKNYCKKSNKLVAFGSESMDKINRDLIIGALKQGYYTAPELTKITHFNPDIPEYHNVYLPNKNGKKAIVYDGNQWNYKNVNEVIDKLYIKNKCFVTNNLDKFASSLNDNEMYALKKWLDMDDDTDNIKSKNRDS